LGRTEGPVNGRVAIVSVAGIVTTLAQSEDLESEFSTVAAIKNVQVVTVYLETAFNGVATMGIYNHVVKLSNGGIKLLHDIVATKRGQGTSIRIGSGSAPEGKAWETIQRTGFPSTIPIEFPNWPTAVLNVVKPVAKCT